MKAKSGTLQRAILGAVGMAILAGSAAAYGQVEPPRTRTDRSSQNDEPLKQVRTQDVAVLFVDIVGFTSYAEGKTPEETITTLREFHGQMWLEVFLVRLASSEFEPGLILI